MNTKKTIILGIISLAVLGGLVWYASQNDLSIANQAASIFRNNPEEGEVFQPVEEEFILGSPEAPVTIIEYSSHFCGHCANFRSQTLPLIMEEYIKTGQVKLISRRLSPSEIGQALLCAQEQDKFQEADDYLFENSQGLIEQIQGATSEDDLNAKVADWLKAMAGNLNLNQDSFNQCFDSSRYEEKVLNWFNQASQDNITGTPSFLINGQLIVGSQPYEKFKEIIEQGLNQ